MFRLTTVFGYAIGIGLLTAGLLLILLQNL